MQVLAGNTKEPKDFEQPAQRTESRIVVNAGVYGRLDKPKTRISYADTRVFVGGVREI